MKKSLLFLPDISGFTKFVQSTEVAHSQHVISELLEILLAANTQNLQLAEIEGDALFFYKEEEIPSLEKLLAQVETMFTAFYSHLDLLKKNRICPCNACSSAPNLQLKIVAHCGEIQFITVQKNRKPFGTQVIEAHRLMKNSVNSDNYVLLSKGLTDYIMLPDNYKSNLFDFKAGKDKYDGKDIEYAYSIIDNEKLKLNPFPKGHKVKFTEAPAFSLEKEYPISAPELLEIITNYNYRHYWIDGVDKFEYNEDEVTRLGSEHICVINGRHINVTAVAKEGSEGMLSYGELTDNIPLPDKLYQFFILHPISDKTCRLEVEVYLQSKSFIKRWISSVFFKKFIHKKMKTAMAKLLEIIEEMAKKKVVKNE
jgi:hypothetical protein